MVGINKPFLEILPICINERTAEPERNSFSKSKISKVTFIIIVALSLFNINSKEHFIIRAHTCEGFEVHIQAILLALCRSCFFSTIRETLSQRIIVLFINPTALNTLHSRRALNYSHIDSAYVERKCR